VSEALELLLLVLALYVFECAQWTPLGAVGFHALLPGWWRRVRPWAAGPSWGRGAILGAPWPPLSPPLICEPLPLGLGPKGIGLRGDEPRWLSWEEVGEVSFHDRDLFLDGKLVARLATRRLTQLLGRLVREVADLKPAKRAARLKRLLEARHDEKACRPRLAAFGARVRPLLVAASLLWLTIFVGVPLVVWTPLTVFWLELAALALLAWIASAIAFRLTLGGLDWLDRAGWPDGTHRFLAMASPLSSMRAADLLGRELCADLDPLAAAAALLPAARFGELARHALLDLDEAEAASSGDSPAAEDARWLIAEQRACLLALLERRDLHAEQLLAPPGPEDDRVQSWCPRCRSQYLQGETCPGSSCGRRKLVPFQRVSGAA
jgi:hypothetical protein